MNLSDILWKIQDDVVTVTDGTIGSSSGDLSFIKTLSFDELIQRFVQGIVTLAINLTVALIVFYIGKFIINRIYSVVGKVLVSRQIDSSLMTFVLSFVKIVLYFILIVTVIGILGIETSSFLALFASAGVAIGMALSGTLQNFAGGVLILLLKPYRVGNYIEAQGFGGYVKEIQIFHTIRITPDNKVITIPNGPLSTGSINNWSSETSRRVDWTVSISYGDKVSDARDAILAILNSDARILHLNNSERPDSKPTVEEPEETHESNETGAPIPGERESKIYNFFQKYIIPSVQRRRERKQEQREYIKSQVEKMKPNLMSEPSVVVTELADSSVVLKARAWVETQNYWEVLYDIYEKIYNKLPDSGVNFPFPQLDVHFDNKSYAQTSNFTS